MTTSTGTSLRRVGNNSYNGMLVAIARPEGWQKKQMLMRFEEENGTSTVFIVEDKALPSFTDCELWRIYDIAVSGRCVRTSSGEQRFGVRKTIKIHLKYQNLVPML